MTVRLEKRDVANGGVWLPIGGDIVLDVDTQNPQRLNFQPYLIVPKNHDIRARARADSNTAEVFAEFGGYLAQVRGPQ